MDAYPLISTGLKAMGDFVGAASAPAKSEYIIAKNAIRSAEDPKERQRCAIGVLRSLDKDTAGKLDQNLLSGHGGAGIGTATLLPFPPGNTAVSDLEKTVDEFIAKNTQFSEVQHKVKAAATNGIKKANESCWFLFLRSSIYLGRFIISKRPFICEKLRLFDTNENLSISYFLNSKSQKAVNSNSDVKRA